MHKARYWRDREFETVKQLLTVTRANGESLPKLGVAWLMANPTTTSVIHGASRSDQLIDTLAAAVHRAEFMAAPHQVRASLPANFPTL
jgi:aryl-alcohol dehydrogenase-like predicted oxidoreductase